MSSQPRIRSVDKPAKVSAKQEERARRKLGQPARPQLIEEPEKAKAPWSDGGVAIGIDPDEVRPHLMESLFQMHDVCDSDAGEAFLNRLIRLMGTDKLDLPPFPDVAWELDSLLRQGDPPLVKVVN